MPSPSVLPDVLTPDEEREVLADQRAADMRVLIEGGARIGGPVTDPADPTVPDDVFVRMEGEWVKWKDLTLQDRKAYLAGGYPY